MAQLGALLRRQIYAQGGEALHHSSGNTGFVGRCPVTFAKALDQLGAHFHHLNPARLEKRAEFGAGAHHGGRT